LELLNNATPAPLNYKGFPKSICTSVNHVVCHGIPTDKKLQTGDMLNIDVTVILDGWHGDTSRMYHVGEPTTKNRLLSDATHDAMMSAIQMVRAGATVGDLGYATEQSIKNTRFSIVPNFCGHGIGRRFHEDPQILSYGTPGEGPVLHAGQFITVEPIVNAGKADNKVLGDGWTVVSRDRSPSAQWEHTVAVLEDGYEILTLSDLS
jgi:methionyl aminopeptidase